MRTDTEGSSGQQQARDRRAAAGPEHIADATPGGYEGIALRVIDGLAGGRAGRVIVNTRNGGSMPFLDADDVVEVPALVDGGGVAPLATGGLPRPARGLVMSVKEYERAVVGAAVAGDAQAAALALAQHPLVPGVSIAKEMISEYRELHGPQLAHLH
jgi:6-phospho-beta-glucosidase